jgi:hypothetical protein
MLRIKVLENVVTQAISLCALCVSVVFWCGGCSELAVGRALGRCAPGESGAAAVQTLRCGWCWEVPLVTWVEVLIKVLERRRRPRPRNLIFLAFCSTLGGLKRLDYFQSESEPLMRIHGLFLAIGILVTHAANAQVHGSMEFETDSTFTPPKGVKAVTVEMWGAGGAGGAAGANFGGGGGGAGGYVRGLVGVKGKPTFKITVGKNNAGVAGRSSIFADPLDNPLLTATGGSNGASGATGGGGGAGGTGSPATMLVRTGAPGASGIAGSSGTGGAGGAAVRGSIELPKPGIAAGADGSSIIIGGGGPGHVLVSW